MCKIREYLCLIGYVQYTDRDFLYNGSPFVYEGPKYRNNKGILRVI